jgi:hypothetical protein
MVLLNGSAVRIIHASFIFLFFIVNINTVDIRNVLQRHIVYKIMLYYNYSLHSLWHKLPHVSLHYMFRPDGAIFMYTGVLQSPFSPSATLPRVASVYTLGERCTYGPYIQRIPNVPEDGPIKPKHVVKGIVWYICATNCVDSNCNKSILYIWPVVLTYFLRNYCYIPL